MMDHRRLWSLAVGVVLTASTLWAQTVVEVSDTSTNTLMESTVESADVSTRETTTNSTAGTTTEIELAADAAFAGGGCCDSGCCGKESCDGGCCDKGCSDGCSDKGCSGCTCKKRKALQAKAKGAYKGLFYANDFSYLDDPCFCGPYFLGDKLKRIPVGRCGNLDVGGQVRLRYHHELGMKGQRFRDVEDDFLLTRVRLFGDYKVNNYVRFFLEGIYADSSFEDFGTRPIDENFGDFLNGFIDLKLTDSLTARLGRQELLYGAQRLVSPLDWANTRRTFEGARVLYKEGDLSLDAFFTNPVPVVRDELDEANYDRRFYGGYSVYSGFDNATVDSYYIGFDDTNIGQSLHTLGARVNGSCPCSNWLYEVEGGVQFGKRSTGVDHEGEGFVTGGIGYAMKDMAWTPTLWCYFDYASENFNQLFPLAHKYLGYIDAVARQNIESPNILLTMKPTKKTKLLIWYYHFQTNSDAPVQAIGGTPPQNGSRYLGNELDILGTINLTDRSDLLIGWSHFWRGNKIENPQDADFVYVQWHRNF